MTAILAIALLLLVVFGPQLWAKSTLRAHAGDRSDLPGTGGELARHLLDQLDLEKVGVEVTDRGDHYDPTDKMVRLSPDNHDGRSITAVAVAAHEVGHAIQDRDGYRPLASRHKLVRWAALTDRVGSVALIGLSMFGGLAVSPRLLLLGVVAVVVMGLVAVVVHLVTLPVEFDASFGRAMPILDHGGYLPSADIPAARRILMACAFTYVSAALVGMLNLLRFLRYFR